MNKTAKTLVSCLALLLAMPSQAQRHTVEYFWNTDPGINRGKMVNGDLGSDNSMEVTLNANGLRPGMNTLGMRVFNGKEWSPTVTRFVFAPLPTTTLTRAVCEYYWDTDPGLGKGKSVSVASDGTGILELDLDAKDIAAGIHRLGMRVHNGSQWSPTVSRFVFVPYAAEAITSAICEYYWDKDPGIGCANRLSVSTTGIGEIDLELAADGLSPGMHTLGMRTCINGIWSTTVRSMVFVSEPTLAKIDAVEYFWGDDPGYGNGTPIDFESSDVVVIDNYSIDLPDEEQEEYTLTIRAHSAAGGWSTSYVYTVKPLYGDINGDGFVDVTDLNIVIDVICGATVDYKTDVNGDEITDVTDLNLIIDIICGI